MIEGGGRPADGRFLGKAEERAKCVVCSQIWWREKFNHPRYEALKTECSPSVQGRSKFFHIYHLSPHFHIQPQFYTRSHEIKIFGDKIRVELGRNLLGDQRKGVIGCSWSDQFFEPYKAIQKNRTAETTDSVVSMLTSLVVQRG